MARSDTHQVYSRVDIRYLAAIAQFYHKHSALPPNVSALINTIVTDFGRLVTEQYPNFYTTSTTGAYNKLAKYGYTNKPGAPTKFPFSIEDLNVEEDDIQKAIQLMEQGYVDAPDTKESLGGNQGSREEPDTSEGDPQSPETLWGVQPPKDGDDEAGR